MLTLPLMLSTSDTPLSAGLGGSEPVPGGQETGQSEQGIQQDWGQRARAWRAGDGPVRTGHTAGITAEEYHLSEHIMRYKNSHMVQLFTEHCNGN